MSILRLIPNSELDQQDQQESAFHSDSVISALAGEIKRQFEVNERTRQASGIEEEMLECLRQRIGEYDAETLGDIRAVGGSEIYMMVTSTICRTLVSWLEDILLPAGERAWALEPTPIPDLSQQAREQIAQKAIALYQHAAAQGQQVDPEKLRESLEKFVRRRLDEKAEKAADLMEEKIADQLEDSEFYDVLGLFMDNFATFPAAFMKTVYRRNKKLKWGPNGQPVVDEVIEEEDVIVSPFDIYPSPDQTDINNGQLIERIRYTRQTLHSLIGVEGYNDDELRMVLEEYATGGLHKWYWRDYERRSLEGRTGSTFIDDGTIEALRMMGSVSGLLLLEWGMGREAVQDPTADYDIEAILIGSHVIKVLVNDDPLGKRDIYMASFQRRPGAFWGVSPPRLCRDSQRMCNATARAIANNMGLAAGPQVMVLKDFLPEGEEVIALHALKIWQLEADKTGQVKSPVEFYQPQLIADKLMNVFEYFETKASDQTNIPKYTYGNERITGAGTTAQGLAMLMENASKGIKAAVRHIDKGIIQPRIERQYVANMLHEDDESIKGDLQVVTRGSSALVAKAATQARRNETLGMTSNPIDMEIVGIGGRAKMLRKHFDDLDMPGIIPEDDEIQSRIEAQQQGGQQQDPRIVATQMQTEAKLKEQQMEAEDNERDRQLQIALASVEHRDKQADTEAKYKQLLDQGKLRLGEAAMRERGQSMRQAREISVKNRHGEGL